MSAPVSVEALRRSRACVNARADRAQAGRLPRCPDAHAFESKKYAPNADDSAIKGTVKHCGIALQSRDGSFVSCTDKAERERIRDSFLKKRLALVDSDADLDKAVMAVCETTKADRDKSRVAFYLLAEKYGKLAMFQ